MLLFGRRTEHGNIRTKREFMHISFPLRHIQFYYSLLCVLLIVVVVVVAFINTEYMRASERLTQLFLLRSVYFLQNPFFASFCIMFFVRGTGTGRGYVAHVML